MQVRLAAPLTFDSIVDGPGLRTVLWTQGCPHLCPGCHNPQTHDMHSGFEMSSREIIKQIKATKLQKGITLSGGEPLLQAEEVIVFLRLCKENKIHTAIETCGMFSSRVLEEVIPLVDLFLWDIKDTDVQRHKAYTGASNEKILENLLRADDLGARTRIRSILVNGVNMEQKHYDGIVEILRRLKHCEGVEFMPYHTYGGSKVLAVGKEDDGNEDWIPSIEQVDTVKTFFADNGIKVF